jgi:hypothetical protein
VRAFEKLQKAMRDSMKEQVQAQREAARAE